jgi:hypothetical protein
LENVVPKLLTGPGGRDILRNGKGTAIILRARTFFASSLTAGPRSSYRTA